MNEGQLDKLLGELRGREGDALEFQSADALCGNVRRHIQRRRRNVKMTLCIATLLLAGAFGWMQFNGRQDNDSAPKVSTSSQAEITSPYAIVQTMFPETGVAMVNGEILTCEQQDGGVKELRLRMQLMAQDGDKLLTIDLDTDDGDYIVMGNDQMTGNLLVSRCDDGSLVIDVGLEFQSADVNELSFNEIFVLNSTKGVFQQNHCTLTIEVLPTKA